MTDERDGGYGKRGDTEWTGEPPERGDAGKDEADETGAADETDEEEEG